MVTVTSPNFIVNPSTSWGALLTSDNPELIYGSIRIAVSNIDGIDKIWVYKGGMDTSINPNILSTEIVKSVWYNVTITISKSKIKFYLNDVQII